MKRCFKFLRKIFLKRKKKKGLIVSSQIVTIDFISLIGEREMKRKNFAKSVK